MINKDFWHSKKVFITGHTGFKGSWLTKILLKFGADICGYSLEPNITTNLFEILNLKDQINNHINDIRDIEKLSNAFHKFNPDIFFHLAAQPLVRDSYDFPHYTYETNIMGTVNVLECIKHSKSVKAGIIVTTDKVYKNLETTTSYKESDNLGGHDPYSCSKACTELITDSYNNSFFNSNDNDVRVDTVRAGNVIGGGDWSKDRLIPDFVKSLMENDEEVIIRNPKSIRPWQHVLDALSGYILLAQNLYSKKTKGSESWNFAPELNDKQINVEELVHKMIKIIGAGNYKIEVDQSSKHEASLLKLDPSKAISKLGWKPKLKIDEALEWTIEWYKMYYAKTQSEIISFSDQQISKYFNY